jgi:protoporphyrinogen oxidase
MRAIWTPLLKGKFGRYFDTVSMAWLWARIHIRANSRKVGGREQLGYLLGGFEVIVRKLESVLAKRNVLVQCSQEVKAILPNERALMTSAKRVEFDACIFTGPCSALARLLPNTHDLESYRQRLESITYIGAVCMVFVSDQDIGEQYWLNVNETGAPFLVFIHHTRLIDKAHYNGKHVYYLGTYEPHDGPRFAMNDEQLAQNWFEFLRTIFPAFDPARVLEKHVFKLRCAQHIVDTQYPERIPDYRTPLPGVYLANFAQVFPEDRGTNYAVREGRRIASLVRSDLGLEAPS